MNTISRLFILSLIVILPGCGGMLKGKAAAEQSLAEFHKLYNDGKFTEIYSASHSKFKGASDEKDFLKLQRVVLQKLGKVTHTSNINFNVRGGTRGTTVVMKQSTTFEKGTAIEVFSFQIEGEKALLIAYNINSKDLIMR